MGLAQVGVEDVGGVWVDLTEALKAGVRGNVDGASCWGFVSARPSGLYLTMHAYLKNTHAAGSTKLSRQDKLRQITEELHTKAQPEVRVCTWMKDRGRACPCSSRRTPTPAHPFPFDPHTHARMAGQEGRGGGGDRVGGRAHRLQHGHRRGGAADRVQAPQHRGHGEGAAGAGAGGGQGATGGDWCVVFRVWGCVVVLCVGARRSC